jgi:hypothetical protein
MARTLLICKKVVVLGGVHCAAFEISALIGFVFSSPAYGCAKE